MADRKIVEQAAKEMPDMKDVKLRMTNLHLHASGVFSNVYKGTLMLPNGLMKEVAIKKTWPENRDRNFEMIFLTGVSRQRHKNIVQMLYAFSNKMRDDRVCESFVFDFMPETLSSLIRKYMLDMTDIKLYTFQLFTGLKYLAQENIIHRDIKPVNILIDHKKGLLKIGDFGSAKIIHKQQASTAYQITRFYRPPELLLGSTYYGCSVDLWSAGCCVGEMFRRQVLFAGRDGKQQLRLIVNVLGIPTSSDIRAMRVPIKLEAIPQERIAGLGLQSLIPDPSLKEAVNLLSKVLVYKPKERLGGRELLTNSFFDSILTGETRRANGQKISSIITPSDVREAQSEVPERKISRLSQLISRKVDFAFEIEKKESKQEEKKNPKSRSNSDELEKQSEEKKKLQRTASRPSFSSHIDKPTSTLRLRGSGEEKRVKS